MGLFSSTLGELHRAYLEITNYLFIWRVIKANAGSKIFRNYEQGAGTREWRKHNLRHDRLGRIYTTLHLPQEMMDLEGERGEAIRVGQLEEDTIAMNDVILTMLGDDGYDSMEIGELAQVPDTRSWLIVYTPRFVTLDKGFFFKWGLIVALILGALFML
jgi:hypothetical protein